MIDFRLAGVNCLAKTDETLPADTPLYQVKVVLFDDPAGTAVGWVYLEEWKIPLQKALVERGIAEWDCPVWEEVVTTETDNLGAAASAAWNSLECIRTRARKLLEEAKTIGRQITDKREASEQAIRELRAGPPTFRETWWGMSEREARATEDGQPLTRKVEGDRVTVAFQRTVAGLDCFATYDFVRDRLVGAGYVFTEEHSSPNLYIEDFDLVERALKGKYGSPSSSGTIWKNDLFRDDPSEWGKAVSVGHLVYRSVWSDKHTTIVHDLSGDNFKVSHFLLYQSKDLEYLSELSKNRTYEKVF